MELYQRILKWIRWIDHDSVMWFLHRCRVISITFTGSCVNAFSLECPSTYIHNIYSTDIIVTSQEHPPSGRTVSCSMGSVIMGLIGHSHKTIFMFKKINYILNWWTAGRLFTLGSLTWIQTWRQAFQTWARLWIEDWRSIVKIFIIQVSVTTSCQCRWL